MSRVFFIDCICLHTQEIKHSMFIIFVSICLLKNEIISPVFVCHHIPTQKREYMYIVFVSICLHKQEITIPMFVYRHIHSQSRDYTFHALSSYTFTIKSLHFPGFCQHIHVHLHSREYTSHVFVSRCMHKQHILLFPMQLYANKDRHDTSCIFVFSICP